MRLGSVQRTLRTLAWLLILTAFAGVGLVAAASPQASPPTAPRPLAFLARDQSLWFGDDQHGPTRQVTHDLAVRDVVWAPSGDAVALTADQNGQAVVAIADLGTGAVHLLGPGAQPSWTADGSRLAYLDHGTIRVVDHTGAPLATYAVGASTIRWAPDGHAIGFTQPAGGTQLAPECPSQVLGWIDTATGQARSIGTSFGDFAWQGTGSAILYVSGQDATLWRYDLASGKAQQLLARTPDVCHSDLIMSADGTTVFFLDATSSGRTLIALSLASGRVREYPNLPIGYPGQHLPHAYLWIDPTAQVAYVTQSYPTTVTRIDLASGAQTTLLQNDYRMLLAVAPDGQTLALLDNPTGKPPIVTLLDLTTRQTHALNGIGWLAWQPPALTPLAFQAWQAVWDREDRPVAAGAAQRTWMWGPQPFAVFEEPYADATGGHRAVEYWDKARMEVNQPRADRSNRWYVTNGLLVRELITGQLQVGDNQFIPRAPAQIPVAGDPDDQTGPTYATLARVLTAPPTPVGAEIRQRLHRDGTVTQDGPGGVHAAYLVPQTQHTIADVFWAYLQSEGPIWNGQAFVTGKLFDPLFFATGYPITEAYWAQVKVGGQVKDVLIQCFERRCLTYTPSNPPGWQVEMGNVGWHYARWRYGF